MGRSMIVGILLLLCLTTGICLEPDSGTAASVGAPDISGLSVGAYHAKTLPRIPTAADILLLAAPVLLLAVLVQRLVVWTWCIPVERMVPPALSHLLGPVRALRGPPALA